jgi:hypothetical protein
LHKETKKLTTIVYLMQINDNLVLSPFTLQALYGTSLYSIEDAEGKLFSQEKPVKIHKKITVITTERMENQQAKPGYIFLQGILEACRVKIIDVALVSPGQNEMDYNKLQEKYHAGLVLLFGITPGDISLPVYFPHFQLEEFSGVTYLSSPELTLLEKDKLLKSKLWLCLKQFFSI